MALIDTNVLNAKHGKKFAHAWRTRNGAPWKISKNEQRKEFHTKTLS